MAKEMWVRMGIGPEGAPIVTKKLDADLTVADLIMMVYAIDDIKRELTAQINKSSWRMVQFKKKEEGEKKP